MALKRIGQQRVPSRGHSSFILTSYSSAKSLPIVTVTTLGDGKSLPVVTGSHIHQDTVEMAGESAECRMPPGHQQQPSQSAVFATGGSKKRLTFRRIDSNITAISSSSSNTGPAMGQHGGSSAQSPDASGPSNGKDSKRPHLTVITSSSPPVATPSMVRSPSTVALGAEGSTSSSPGFSPTGFDVGRDDGLSISPTSPTLSSVHFTPGGRDPTSPTDSIISNASSGDRKYSRAHNTRFHRRFPEVGDQEKLGVDFRMPQSGIVNSDRYCQKLSMDTPFSQKFHLRHTEVYPKLVNYYSCALLADILLQGYLYISENYFGFYSNIFGYKTKLLIPMGEVLSVTKKRTAKIIPNAVGICTEDDKYVFGSLLYYILYYILTYWWTLKSRSMNRLLAGQGDRSQAGSTDLGQVCTRSDGLVC